MNNVSDFLDVVKSEALKNTLGFYIASVPDKPYCCDLDHFLRILPKNKALEFPKIQYNKPNSVSIITLDIDHTKWTDHYLDVTLPPPNIITFSPINGKAHLQYHLLNKVYVNNVELRKAVNLLAAVEHTLTLEWEADKSFSGLISKNPLHNSNDFVFGRLEPWTLDELKEALPPLINKPPRISDFTFGVGRNVSLFEYLRFKGYSYFTKHNKTFNVDNCKQYLLDFGEEQNQTQFTTPLVHREVAQICKNIATYIDRKFDYLTFREIQKSRNKKSIEVRRAKKENMFLSIKEIKSSNPFLSNRDIAKKLGVDEKTVRNAFLYFSNLKSEYPLFDIFDDLWHN